MTQQFTVSLPDDVAARLQHESDVSAYVAAAVRRHMDHEHGSQILAEQGFAITPEGRERAQRRLAEARARMTPERWAELRTSSRRTPNT